MVVWSASQQTETVIWIIAAVSSPRRVCSLKASQARRPDSGINQLDCPLTEVSPFTSTITHTTSTIIQLHTTSTITHTLHISSIITHQPASTIPQPSLTLHFHSTSTITHSASPHYLNHHSHALHTTSTITHTRSTLRQPSLTPSTLSQPSLTPIRERKKELLS